MAARARLGCCSPDRARRSSRRELRTPGCRPASAASGGGRAPCSRPWSAHCRPQWHRPQPLGARPREVSTRRGSTVRCARARRSIPCAGPTSTASSSRPRPRPGGRRRAVAARAISYMVTTGGGVRRRARASTLALFETLVSGPAAAPSPSATRAGALRRDRGPPGADDVVLLRRDHRARARARAVGGPGLAPAATRSRATARSPPPLRLQGRQLGATPSPSSPPPPPAMRPSALSVYGCNSAISACGRSAALACAEALLGRGMRAARVAPNDVRFTSARACSRAAVAPRARGLVGAHRLAPQARSA